MFIDIKRPIFYGWWIAFTACVVNAILSAPSYGATGLWLDALEGQFGWSRTQLSIAFSLGQLEGSIAAPLVGYLIDKIGGKKVAICGVIVASVGFLCLSQTTPITPHRDHWLDPLIFYFAYVVIMLGVTLGGWIPMTVIINNWFDKNKTLAMSIGSVGFSIGTFALVPIIAILIAPENLGWKATSISVSIIFLLLLIPLGKLIKNSPDQLMNVPHSRVNYEGGKDNVESIDFSITEAVKEKVFWFMAFGHGSSAMLTTTMMVHLILAFKSQGMSIQLAALMWGITMGIGGISQIIGGIVGDRISKRIAVCVFGCLQAVGVATAVLVTSIPLALIFAVTYGVGFGGRAPITTAMRGEYFGRTSFGKIMGISAVPMMVMTMIAPILAGRLYDHTGNYSIAFLLIATIGFFGSLIFLLATKPVHPSIRQR